MTFQGMILVPGWRSETSLASFASMSDISVASVLEDGDDQPVPVSLQTQIQIDIQTLMHFVFSYVFSLIFSWGFVDDTKCFEDQN